MVVFLSVFISRIRLNSAADPIPINPNDRPRSTKKVMGRYFFSFAILIFYAILFSCNNLIKEHATN